ncbi:MAG: ATP synthase F1 subunit gamma [Melioribacteraceae bacterium]|nr:ATP synthase F1 subunit gamma [Melioribacteraceae bacterium]
MATLRDIKSRIKGVKNTQQITKAMKMVAAARLRRAQENMINAKPYSRKIAQVLSNLIALEKGSSNPLFEEREVENVAIIIITSDRGLCGGFNMNAIRAAEELIHEEFSEIYEKGNLSLYCIGKKGLDHFRRRDYNIPGKHPGIFSDLNFEFASAITTELTTKFLNKEFDKVVLVYNEFKSVIQQTLIKKQILPIKPFEEETVDDEDVVTEFIFEPDKQTIIDTLLPRHLKAQVWTALLDSYAAELGARMTAMDMATENAKEMIRTLNIKYNKERQAAITKEILEIVSGANALKES